MLGIAKEIKPEKYVGPILEEWKDFIDEEAKKAARYEAPDLNEDEEIGTRADKKKE